MPKIIKVSGPVIVEKNSVLLNISGDDKFWKFCGGKVKRDETPIETAKREIKEEMGIEIEILDQNPFLLHVTKKLPKGEMYIVLNHFLAKRIGKIFPADDVHEWQWIKISKLQDENLAPNIIPALKHFGFIQ
jgi:8-oxo-dGTP diphosphatase